MSVVSVGIGLPHPGKTMAETPAHIAGAITGFTSTGSGSLTNFRVNNKLVKRKLTYKKSLRLERGLGLFADGKLIKRIKKEDTWSIGTATCLGTTVNRIDADKAFELWSKDNPGKTFEDMPKA
jgi:hypothetical protein